MGKYVGSLSKSRSWGVDFLVILVVLGTQDKSFCRLLEMLETVINEEDLQDQILVQAGYTKFTSDKMEIHDYFDMVEFERLLQRCDFLITHGGVGTIMAALKLGKKVIASPRKAQFGEHHNDHQQQIVDSFEEKGYILACTNLEQLRQSLQSVHDFIPKQFVSNQKKFTDLIRKEIEGFE